MRKLITLFGITLLLGNSSALAINLNDALVSCYENNDDLKLSRKAFQTEIEAFPQAISGFLPSIGARVDSNLTKTKAQSKFSSAPSSDQRNVGRSLIIQQPVFSGGGGMAALKTAQESFRASRGKYYSQEQNTFLGAITAYLDFYEAGEKFRISDTSVRTNQKQLESIEERFKLGESTTTDLATARANLASAETQQLSFYANLQTAKANFIRIFGIEPQEISIPNIPDNLPSSLEELEQKSRANPALYNARHNVAAAKSQEWTAKAALLPRADFNIQAGKNFPDPEIRGTSTINSFSVSSTFSVQIPILTQGGAEYSRIRTAKNNARTAIITLDSQEKKVHSDCITAWEGFNAAKSQIISATKFVDAAQIAYDGTVHEEAVGSKTILDVFNAEDKLNSAKIQKVAAEKAYVIAAFQMKSLVGQLTAKSLGLKVKYFSPEAEFKKTKIKVIGS
jgi:outer membrane protein